MKVIDLLNKIANGEDIPKKIKIKDEIWTYDDDIDYKASDDRGYMFEVHTRINEDDLNEEIKIIEEEKIMPEKIKDKYCSQISKVELAQKYNEIIDYLDYLKSKGE